MTTHLLPLPRQARLLPDKPALVTPRGSLTYAALSKRADARARRLAALGAGAGDRVAACVTAPEETAVLLHAAARIGAVFAPLNTRLTATDLAAQLAALRPAVAVWDGRLADRLPPLPPDCRLAGAGPEADRLAARPIDDVPPTAVDLFSFVPAGDPHTIVFTSGSAGRPRGVVLTHGNHLWSALASALRLGVAPDDRWLAPLPLFHVGGLSVLLRSALYGTAAVLPDRFDAETVARSLREDDVTLVSLVPTVLVRLLDAWGDAPAPDGLRAVLLGGAAAPPDLIRRAAAAGFPVCPTYGLTEAASQVATNGPADDPTAALAPLPFVELRIAGADGREVAPGTEGEIQVRGPTVAAGYWADPDSTARTFPDGWLHTRDRGEIDSSGRLHVLGRGSEMIVTGGENVHASEVEAVLDAHPDVVESCVVGVPHAEWGERVEAVLVGTPRIAERDASIEAHARAHLAGFKVPRAWHWRSEPLPRTPAGKVLRDEVVAWVAAVGGRRG